MCLAAPPAAQDHCRGPRRRAWHTVGALAGCPTPQGRTWRDPVVPLPRSPCLGVLAADQQASPVQEPSLADPDGMGWCGGRLSEVTTFFPPFHLDFSWICFSLASSLPIRRNTDEAALTKNVHNGAVRVFGKGHLFLKAASRLEALPELPPEALMPPCRPVSEQRPPPVTRPVPRPPAPPSSVLPPGLSPGSQLSFCPCPGLCLRLPPGAVCASRGPVPCVWPPAPPSRQPSCEDEIRVRCCQSHPGSISLRGGRWPSDAACPGCLLPLSPPNRMLLRWLGHGAQWHVRARGPCPAARLPAIPPDPSSRPLLDRQLIRHSCPGPRLSTLLPQLWPSPTFVHPLPQPRPSAVHPPPPPSVLPFP